MLFLFAIFIFNFFRVTLTDVKYMYTHIIWCKKRNHEFCNGVLFGFVLNARARIRVWSGYTRIKNERDNLINDQFYTLEYVCILVT